MSCYHPRIRIENLNKWETAADGHKYHPARIEQPNDVWQRIEDIKNSQGYKYQLIPCRNCIGCRLDYSRQWANRGYLEAKYHKNNYFITLTYDEEHIPIPKEITTKNGITFTNEENWNGCLEPKHIEKFLHDLRQRIKLKYGDYKIKYMACGEYGDKGARPHYHLIIFGLELPIETFYKPRIINNETYWQNTEIEKCWKHGISNITEASWNNIAYTARYITKKINGKDSDETYASIGKIKEFFRVSKGIGKQYFEDNIERITKTGNVTIKNTNGAQNTSVPHYYLDLLGKTNEEAVRLLQEKRRRIAKNREKALRRTHGYGTLEQLAIQENYQSARTLKLKRTYENGG